ncbi:MAG: hypothetical protein M3O72_08695 [Verrucomicrobiota bacterium]|nr:hypothetical protein [Verrucomicrobiota bacterium]
MSTSRPNSKELLRPSPYEHTEGDREQPAGGTAAQIHRVCVVAELVKPLPCEIPFLRGAPDVTVGRRKFVIAKQERQCHHTLRKVAILGIEPAGGEPPEGVTRSNEHSKVFFDIRHFCKRRIREHLT